MATVDTRAVVAEALLEIRTLRAKVEAAEQEKHAPIAILGIGCRFPGGADSPDALWGLLERGGETISAPPPERWSLHGPAGALLRWGSFLEGVGQFDPMFFGISPREAVTMDPQQRLFLEVAIEALEGAGQPLHELAKSRTGVFVGVCSADYWQLIARDHRQIDTHSATGLLSSVLSGRLSYCLGLEGPSIVLDTACSASLVATHLAVRSLRSKECDLAIVGGVNVMLSDSSNALVNQLQGLAPDGKCKTFDAAANGTVRGEGCGVVVLKRLGDALRDGDPVRAVIRGSAVNQDGRSTSLTSPNVLSQQAVIREALADARVAAERVGYVEAHGTGTSLGDPIEFDALRAVYGDPRADGSRCALGALKTNIGHTEAAAGVAGLIKAVLGLERGKVPANLHFQALNPRMSLEGTPFVLPGALIPWPGTEGPRVAAVSAFGVGGTNAHVVLEQAPESSPVAEAADRPTLLTLSAKTDTSLAALARKWLDFLPRSSASLNELARGAAMRRSHHEHRLAIACETTAELKEELERFVSGGEAPIHGRSPKIAFVFSGQGGQFATMGRDLLEKEPVFRASMERCDAAVHAVIGWSVLDELRAASRLGETAILQPVLFSVQVSLAALWASYGIVPGAVLGHSVGEVAAAHVAGAIGLEDAAKLVTLRGELLGALRGHGEIALVALSKDEAEAAIEGHQGEVTIAALNGPRATVISGTIRAVDAIVAELQARGVFCRVIEADGAGHGPQAQPLKEELERRLDIEPRAGAIPFYSTVHGAPVDGRELGARYWGDNVRQPILFAPTIEKLAEEGFDAFVEISPHPVLSPSVRDTLRARASDKPGSVVPSMRREGSQQRTFLRSLGDLYQLGATVDFAALFPKQERSYSSASGTSKEPRSGERSYSSASGTSKEPRSGERFVFVPIPTYAWDHADYLIDPPAEAPTRHRAASSSRSPSHPLLGEEIPLALEAAPRVFEVLVDLEAAPFLRDHRLFGTIVFPGAAFIDLMWSAATRAFGSVAALEQVRFEHLLTMKEDAPKKLQVVLERQSDERARVTVASIDERAGFARHVEALVRLGKRAAVRVPESIDNGAGARLQKDAFYEKIGRLGLSFGPTFKGVEEVRAEGARAVAQIRVPEGIESELDRYGFHPALLDIFFQSTGGFIVDDLRRDESLDRLDTFLPTGVARIVIHDRLSGNAARSYARLEAKDHATIRAGLVATSAEGAPLLEVEGLTLSRLSRTQVHDELRPWLSAITWPAVPALAELATAKKSDPSSIAVLSDDDAVVDVLTAAVAKRGIALVRLPLSTLDPGRSTLGGDSTAIVLAVGLSTSSRSSSEHLGGELAARLARLVKLVTDGQAAEPPRLFIVTRGVAAVGASSPTAFGIAGAQLHGMARTLAYEHPQLKATVIDLDPAVDEGGAWTRELFGDSDETLVAYRAGKRHVGRLAASEFMPARDAIELSSDATYLVTGGLGFLGLRLARYLVDRGARSLVLAGRSDPKPTAREQIAAMEAAGAKIELARVNVASGDEVARLFERIDRTLPPLRGVFHLAVELDDAAIVNLDPDRIARVFGPKARAAEHLHAQTEHRLLDHFVLFSSAASVLGTPGQASYAAANACLDALSEYRRGLGLPAIAVNFGVFEQAGGQTERLTERGAKILPTDFALSALGRLLKTPKLGAIGLFRIDLEKWGAFHPVVKRTPFFVGQVDKPEADQGGAFRQRLREAPAARRIAMIEGRIREEVGRVLRMPPARFERDVAWASYGIDSLMGLEIRNRLEVAFDLVLPAIVLYAEPNLSALCAFLATKFEASGAPEPAREEAAPPAVPSGADTGGAVRRIERMSEEEAKLALERKLASLRRGKAR